MFALYGSLNLYEEPSRLTSLSALGYLFEILHFRVKIINNVFWLWFLTSDCDSITVVRGRSLSFDDKPINDAVIVF